MPRLGRPLFNPLSTDFIYTWFNDNNEPIELKIKAKDIEYFEGSQYEFMKKHLVDEVLHSRELVSFVSGNREKIEREVEADG